MEISSKKKESNWWIFPGFELEYPVTGLDLPVNIAFIKNPQKNPKSPLLYITELYGQVKVVTNDWSVFTHTESLLNYKPDYRFRDNIPSVHAAHQIQALTIGFDNKLYVNLGDGMIDSKVCKNI